MLTTTDNPFDPFTQWDEWLAYDSELSRIKERPMTTSLLAYVAKTSDELSEADEAIAIESAIDEIVKQNVLGVYRKVTKDETD